MDVPYIFVSPGQEQTEPIPPGPGPPLDNVLNFRDIGKTANEFMGKKYMKEGVLYRSARPDDASPTDISHLTNHYGILAVLDLRTKTEHRKHLQKRQHRLQAQQAQQPPPVKPSLSRHPTSSSSSTTDLHLAYGAPSPETETPHSHLTYTTDPPHTSLHLPGLTHAHIPLTGRRFELALVWMLGWWDFFTFLSLLLLNPGTHTPAIRHLATTILLPLGLTGSAHQNLRSSGPEVRSALRYVALCVGAASTSASSNYNLNTSSSDSDSNDTDTEDNSDSDNRSADTSAKTTTPLLPSPPSTMTPLLIHCTAGKDRTGLLTLLILLLLRVPVPAITHDYTLTATSGALVSEWEERLAELTSFGFTEEWMGCAPNFVGDTVEFLEREWGGVEGYCEYVGFGVEEVERLRGVLLV